MSNFTEPTLCVCGHFHGGTCMCGCSLYEPDDGSDGVVDDSYLGPGMLPPLSGGIPL